MARERNYRQIIRMDGKNVFVEAMNSAFRIGKIQLNFCSYDDKSKKMTANIPIYLSFEEFFSLKQDVISGRLAKLAEVEKAKGSKYPKEIYTKQGGVSAKNLKARGQERADGMSLSRQMKIVPGLKFPFMVQGEQGAAEENAQGLIVPRYGGKPDDRVMIPMDGDTMKQFFLTIDAHVQAYLNATYAIIAEEDQKEIRKEMKEYEEKYFKRA